MFLSFLDFVRWADCCQAVLPEPLLQGPLSAAGTDRPELALPFVPALRLLRIGSYHNNQMFGVEILGCY